MIDAKTMKRFYEAWHFLNEHPAFERTYADHRRGGYVSFRGRPHKEVRFDQSIDVDVVMTRPNDLTIDEDPKKNTRVQVWIECGRWMSAKELYKGMTKEICDPAGDGAFGHDPRLDCGADTFEEAIIKLARNVKKAYGDKKSKHV